MEETVFVPGRAVISAAGRDCGGMMLIVGVKDGYVYIADGKDRPLERPKRKNPRHLRRTNFEIPLEGLTNRKLKSALKRLSERGVTEEGEQTCLKKM